MAEMITLASGMTSRACRPPRRTVPGRGPPADRRAAVGRRPLSETDPAAMGSPPTTSTYRPAGIEALRHAGEDDRSGAEGEVISPDTRAKNLARLQPDGQDTKKNPAIAAEKTSWIRMPALNAGSGTAEVGRETLPSSRWRRSTTTSAASAATPARRSPHPCGPPRLWPEQEADTIATNPNASGGPSRRHRDRGEGHRSRIIARRPQGRRRPPGR